MTISREADRGTNTATIPWQPGTWLSTTHQSELFGSDKPTEHGHVTGARGEFGDGSGAGWASTAATFTMGDGLDRSVSLKEGGGTRLRKIFPDRCLRPPCHPVRLCLLFLSDLNWLNRLPDVPTVGHAARPQPFDVPNCLRRHSPHIRP